MSRMKQYTFTISISGLGQTAEDAWNDATEAFCNDCGSYPEDYEILE